MTQREAPDPAKIAEDLAVVVSGNFHQRAIGPDLREEIASRVAEFSGDYLAAFERIYLGDGFDPSVHARIFPTALVDLLKERGLPEYRELGETLLRYYSGALATAEAAVPSEHASRLRDNLDDHRTLLRLALEEEG